MMHDCVEARLADLRTEIFNINSPHIFVLKTCAIGIKVSIYVYASLNHI